MSAVKQQHKLDEIFYRHRVMFRFGTVQKIQKSCSCATSLIATAVTGAMIQSFAPMVTTPDNKLNRDALERIAGVFRVFSEATRLQILQELKAGPLNVTQLVETLGVSQANVSKQLRVLHDAGIISRERLGTQAIYEIVDPMTFALCGLVCEKLNREASMPQPTFSL